MAGGNLSALALLCRMRTRRKQGAAEHEGEQAEAELLSGRQRFSFSHPKTAVAAAAKLLNGGPVVLAVKRLFGTTNRSAAGIGRRARLNVWAMRFLSTVFWALIAVLLALFSYRNWTDVTLNLWGDIQADIKIPLLLLILFLLGFLPTWLLMRTRVWTYRRRVEALERTRTSALAVEPATAEQSEPLE